MANGSNRSNGWSGRVRLASGEAPFAYTPKVLLIEEAADVGVVADLVPGAELSVPDDPEGGRTTGGGYRRWSYRGDVVSASRRLRGVGIKAQPSHVFFLDAGPDDLGANPVYGNPVYGNPVYGNPVYGNPVYGNPVYGNPVYGNPVYGNPVYGNPVYGNPVYGNPVYGNPVYGNPVYGNPVYGNPVYGNPVYGSPSGLRCGCNDADACECRTIPAAAPASFVYPNPAYVTKVYPAGEGVAYQLTGQRRSQARPLLGVADDNIGDIGEWETATVRVAVLDNGYPEAAAIANVANTYDKLLGDPVAIPDSDGDGYLDPVAGHGIFIGGLIARIAPGCGLLVKRVLSTYGDGDEFVIAQAIEALTNLPLPPHLLNLSFSGYTLENKAAKCLRNAIRAAMRKGIVVVASAGNDGVCRPAFPAAFKGVVSVAALGPDGPAPFSNWGSWVRACAPGVDVASTFFEFSEGKERPRYGIDPDLFTGWATWSGTSFAAPTVVGVLARTMQADAAIQAAAALAGAPHRPPLTANQAVETVIDQEGLFRLRCYGTVVNQLAVRPLCS